jgi:nucleotide-binding universal stress UspA family protein
MIYLAYDGSVNGDWIARYALAAATRTTDRRVILIHVDTSELPKQRLAEKLERLTLECGAADVTLDVRRLPVGDGVFATLTNAIPPGPESFLFCGARVRGGRRGYLSGTISERLLLARRYNALAVRVVQPGLLGVPHEFLMPVAGAPHGQRSAVPFLRLFGEDIDRVQLLRVMTVGRLAFRGLDRDRLARLRREGRDFLRAVEAALVEEAAIDAQRIDGTAEVSDDWAKEVIIFASRHRSQLILMEASLRDLGRRFLYGNPIEQVLRNAPCDVAVFRGV